MSWLGKTEAETPGFNDARTPRREVRQWNSSKKHALYLVSHLRLEVGLTNLVPSLHAT
jgi:hypothetical protein